MSTRALPCFRIVALTAAVLLLAGCRSAPLAPGGAFAAAAEPPRLERNTVPKTEWVRAAAPAPRTDYQRAFRMVADAPSGEAAGGGGQSAGDLAKAAQNPIANMISLPFQNNANFGIGPNDRTQNILNIQPVYPVKIGRWLMVNRLIAPVILQPDASREVGNWTGLGDINYTAFFVPPTQGSFMWGFGPAFIFPTRTEDQLGKGKFGIGPSAVALAQPGNWVIGGFVQNVWSLEGDTVKDALGKGEPIIEEGVNQFLGQYFVNYNLPDGWYLTSAPIITADWKADPGQKWTVPFGAGFGKIFQIGKQPVNASFQLYYNVVKPDNGPDWQMRFQFQLLFPKG